MQKKFPVLLLGVSILSCGGGSNTSLNGNSNTLTQVSPDVVKTEKGIKIVGFSKSTNQTLEVFIPGAVLSNNEPNSGRLYKALTDLGSTEEMRIPWNYNGNTNGQKIEISGTDPDSYDTLLNFGVNVNDTTLQNLQSTYGVNYNTNATVTDSSLFGFQPILQAEKDSETNKASTYVLFQSFPEGTQLTLNVGMWDLLKEGVKFSIPVKINDLPDVNLDQDYGNSQNCYFYYNPNTGKIEVPTKDGNGNNFPYSHCIAFKVTPGQDDEQYGDTGNLNIYEGNDLAQTENLSYNTQDYTYSLSQKLNGGEEKTVKLEIVQFLNGNANKKDVKTKTFTIYGANDSILIGACLDTQQNDNCQVGAQGDPYGTILSNKFVYKGDTNDGLYAIYFRDDNGNGVEDENEDRVLLNLADGYYVLPSTGGYLYFKTKNYSGTGGIFSFKITQLAT